MSNINVDFQCFALIFIHFSTIVEGQCVAAVLNLFGGIVAQQTQHIIRGLNVVIRMKKTCYLSWPRLLATTQKCHWITNNLEKLSIDDINFYIFESQALKNREEPDFDGNCHDSNIQNSDDLADEPEFSDDDSE